MRLFSTNPRKLQSATVAGVLALMLSSCGDSSADGSSLDTLPVWELSLDHRIGSINDPEQSLSLTGTVLLDAQGNLYVAQPQERVIRVYDSGGRLVRTIGRSGRGPGEFTSLGYMRMKADTLYALDQNRLNLFTLDGGVLESRTFSGEQQAVPSTGNSPFVFMLTPATPDLVVLLPDGRIAARPGLFGSIPGPNPGTPPGVFVAEVTTPILLMDRASAVVDTIAWWQNRPSHLARIPWQPNGFTFPAPFSDAQLMSLMPDGGGVVLVDRARSGTGPSQFRVTRLDAAGDTVFSRAIPYNPISEDQERTRVIAAEIAVSRPTFVNPPNADQLLSGIRDLGVVPEQQVPITALHVGQDGSIWLRREDLNAETIPWLVLSADGALEGTVALPARQTVVAARGDQLVTLEPDELDVPHLVSYRVRR